jgi:polyprenyl-phospho-N-acetylgalactosaminyl synthase
MKKASIIFLIRAYNEATRIREVIEGIYAAGYTQVLVVDDGSTDKTDVLLADWIETSRIHYVRHITNRGAGAALETGFAYIREHAPDNHWEYILTFDADGQMDIADMSKFEQAFETDTSLDIVIGSRFITKTHTNVPPLRRAILWGGRIFTSLVSGIHLTDAHNGYRMLRVTTLEKIQITMDGMEYASELIDQIAIHRLHFCEVPVNIHYDEYTLSKWQRYGGPFRVAFRMIFKKFF